MEQKARAAESRLSDILALHAAALDAPQITFGDILALLGNRSIGALLLILALPMALPIPAPGLSALVGFPLLLVAAQLVMGRERAWLPKRILAHPVPRERFVKMVDYATPRLRRLERLLKPRLPFLCARFMILPVGLACVVMALAITLPIPFGNVVPGIAICLFALGLIQHDGAAILAGFVAAALALLVIGIAITGAGHLARVGWPF